MCCFEKARAEGVAAQRRMRECGRGDGGKREGTGKVLIMQPQFWCPIKYKIFI